MFKHVIEPFYQDGTRDKREVFYIHIKSDCFIENCQDKKHLDYFDWTELSRNKNIKVEDIENNTEYPWNHLAKYANPNYTSDIIKQNIFNNLLVLTKAIGFYLSQNPSLTIDLVDKYPDIFNYYWLSSNRCVSFDYIMKHPRRGWDFDKVSQNPNITWKIVVNNPQVKWNYKLLSSNKNFTFETLMSNRDKPWDFGEFCKNENMTIEIFRNNPDINWSYVEIAKNHNLFKCTIDSEFYDVNLKSGIFSERFPGKIQDMINIAVMFNEKYKFSHCIDINMKREKDQFSNSKEHKRGNWYNPGIDIIECGQHPDNFRRDNLYMFAISQNESRFIK